MNYNIPGVNVLATALSVLGTQRIFLYEYLQSEINDVGVQLSEYAPPVVLNGSVQPISRVMVQKLGLDLNGEHIIFYTDGANVKDISRGGSGDLLEYNDKHYKVIETPADWKSLDDWLAVWAVNIPKKDIAVRKC